MTTHLSSGRPLTGRHVLALFGLGFGTIVAVNVTLAVNAVRTFPGLETANSYVASQSYEARRRAQEALGWTVLAEGRPGGVRIALRDAEGLPPRVAAFSAVIGRATSDLDERAMNLRGNATATADVAPGLWRVDVAGTAPDGTRFERRLTVVVPR